MGKETIKRDCFIIMPIANMDPYENGHFNRVYEHIIEPTCRKAKLNPVRADKVTKTNYIIADIIKRIVEADIVICDVSGRNPNVLYELGIAHAFNKPVVIIKDSRTERIFDIQGIRYMEYDENLRIDNIKLKIKELGNLIINTFENESDNSIIQLLGLHMLKHTQNNDTVTENTQEILESYQQKLFLVKDITEDLQEVFDDIDDPASSEDHDRAWEMVMKNKLFLNEVKRTVLDEIDKAIALNLYDELKIISDADKFNKDIEDNMKFGNHFRSVDQMKSDYSEVFQKRIYRIIEVLESYGSTLEEVINKYKG